ncbi:MAG TPA: dienelactone hydrolase family protein [Phenylobacterium sp.]
MPEARIELEMDDGVLDALVVCPETPGRKSPILLLSAATELVSTIATTARRLSAHNYFVLVPDLARLGAEDSREAARACLDHFADERRVDDTRVGALGFGAGADLALSLAAERSERVAAVAAYGGRGFSAREALEITQKINGLVRIGYAAGVLPRRAAVLEAALNLSGVLFDTEFCDGEPNWADLLDFFARGLAAPLSDRPAAADPKDAPLNL